MGWLREVARRLNMLVHRRQFDADLEEEMRLHVELRQQEQRKLGVAPDDALAAARRQFGNTTYLKEESLSAWGWQWLENLGRDLRYGLRTLRKTPGFTAVAVFTLALGIGATSAIFSVFNGILLKPLPYVRSEELVDLTHSAPGVNLPEADPAPFLYFTYRDQGQSFQSVGLYHWSSRSVTELSEPENAQSVDVTADVLPMLGVQPALGRWFSEKDDAPGSPLTMVLMHGWWEARFGGDRSVIGRQIKVDGISRQVIGVMPAKFRFLDRDAAFLLPLQFDRNKEFLGHFDYPGIARLKPGVTIEQASADIARLIPIALHSFPPQAGLTVKEFEDVRLAPKLKYLKEFLIGDLAKTLWVLMGTIGIVLLIACANVANLLLVRAEGRQQELAIREALGASWRNMASQLLMESLALGLLGGAFGLGFAYGAIRVLIAIAPAHLPRLEEISIDPGIILLTLVIALVTGVMFGMIPVIKYAAPQIATTLRGVGRTFSQSKERYQARRMLVVVQVGLALVLLVGSGLMIRTFQALRRVDPGFDPHDALSLRIAIPGSQVKDAADVIHMQQAIADKIRAIPGVTSVGLTTGIPTELYRADLVYARDKSYSQKTPPLRTLKFISPGLLEAMGNRLIAGREFTWTDTFERRAVAMVSENLARELWEDPQRAIGKQIRENLTGPWREIVGVINDEREDGVQERAPTVACYPLLMNEFQNNTVSVQRQVWYVIRSRRAGSRGLLADVQQAVWSINPNVPLANVRTLQEIYDKSLARTSFTLVMLAIAAAMALLLGTVGLYGVLAYSISQHTREIGIRMALGAQRMATMKLVLGEGMLMVAIGLAVGLVGSLALTRFLSSLLFGVSATDPFTFAAVAVLLALVALAACYISARRAMLVDPIVALRYE